MTFIYDLRFPGQIYMVETGLNQNMQRDYDPQVGRYVESDPIGLDGGANTYACTSDDPVLGADPSGLIEYFTFTLNKKPVSSLNCACG